MINFIEAASLSIKVTCDRASKSVTKVTINDISYDLNAEQSSDISAGTGTATAKQLYLDFIAEQAPSDQWVLKEYDEEDLDSDGEKEAVLAFSDHSDENLIHAIYILKTEHGRIIQIDAELANSGYGVYEARRLSRKGARSRHSIHEVSCDY
ncbi:hypothetical protein [Cohnella sp. OV330]|uniref:hypothetical protein n=1 Tax=Cohnella sp. OV330 TaxID=1855288 RepID=UPI0011605F8B|nr:hypothetical protein [Cohnella sp. OV330]